MVVFVEINLIVNWEDSSYTASEFGTLLNDTSDELSGNIASYLQDYCECDDSSMVLTRDDIVIVSEVEGSIALTLDESDDNNCTKKFLKTSYL